MSILTLSLNRFHRFHVYKTAHISALKAQSTYGVPIILKKNKNAGES